MKVLVVVKAVKIAEIFKSPRIFKPEGYELDFRIL